MRHNAGTIPAVPLGNLAHLAALLRVARYLLAQRQQRSHVVYECGPNRNPEHPADPPLPSVRAVKEHDDSQPHDARRREDRGVRSSNQVLHPLDQRLDAAPK
jgi:hypothetical protein